mmetsp:Transcript_10492/g.27903  ORF Transcript_10492/g.27903 Transcript_10492/m.27903 type:complete len:325 (+) Transcript_10492:2400-3374(+)
MNGSLEFSNETLSGQQKLRTMVSMELSEDPSLLFGEWSSTPRTVEFEAMHAKLQASPPQNESSDSSSSNSCEPAAQPTSSIDLEALAAEQEFAIVNFTDFERIDANAQLELGAGNLTEPPAAVPPQQPGVLAYTAAETTVSGSEKSHTRQQRSVQKGQHEHLAAGDALSSILKCGALAPLVSPITPAVGDVDVDYTPFLFIPEPAPPRADAAACASNFTRAACDDARVWGATQLESDGDEISALARVETVATEHNAFTQEHLSQLEAHVASLESALREMRTVLDRIDREASPAQAKLFYTRVCSYFAQQLPARDHTSSLAHSLN